MDFFTQKGSGKFITEEVLFTGNGLKQPAVVLQSGNNKITEYAVELSMAASCEASTMILAIRGS
jgi:hypothetical protein